MKLDIKLALETRLNAIASPLATQWENLAYKPVAGTPYQQVFFLPNEPLNPEVGLFVQDYGIMQIDLRYPIDKAAKDILVRAEAIRDWFYFGLTLDSNGTMVTVNRTAAILAGRNEGDRYILPVRVYYHSNSN